MVHGTLNLIATMYCVYLACKDAQFLVSVASCLLLEPAPALACNSLILASCSTVLFFNFRATSFNLPYLEEEYHCNTSEVIKELRSKEFGIVAQNIKLACLVKPAL